MESIGMNYSTEFDLYIDILLILQGRVIMV